MTARIAPAIGGPVRAGGSGGIRHFDLPGCTGRPRYRTRSAPESGQDRGEAHECYGNIGAEDRDAHGVEPEPSEQEPAAAKRENGYSELTQRRANGLASDTVERESDGFNAEGKKTQGQQLEDHDRVGDVTAPVNPQDEACCEVPAQSSPCP